MYNIYPATAAYIIILFFSIVITSSSNNWFFTWMGLELSLFGLLPLFSITHTSTQNTIKYYLVQAGASVIYFMSFVFANNFLIISLTINMGIAPFHQWLPLVISANTWHINALIVTIQNIPPLIVYTQGVNLWETYIIGTLTATVAAYMALNQNHIYTLIAYSSISHTSWMLFSTHTTNMLMAVYILTYTIITWSLFNSLERTNTHNIQNLCESENITQATILLILASLPPFSFFVFNILILQTIINTVVVTIILSSTIISAYIYIMCILPQIIGNNTNNTAFFPLFINVIPLFLL